MSNRLLFKESRGRTRCPLIMRKGVSLIVGQLNCSGGYNNDEFLENVQTFVNNNLATLFQTVDQREEGLTTAQLSKGTLSSFINRQAD